MGSREAIASMADRNHYEVMLFIGGPLDGRRLIPASWQHRLTLRKSVATQAYFRDRPIPLEPPDEFTYWNYILREWDGVRFMAEESMTTAQILRALIAKYPVEKE
jgi:hypothetical protein